jgi:hypothetical protein
MGETYPQKEGVPRAAAVRLRSDRLGEVRESGTVHAGAVRVCAMPRIEQRGQADHPVNPGGTGGKWLEGGEASSALGVEKQALSQTTKNRKVGSRTRRLRILFRDLSQAACVV